MFMDICNPSENPALARFSCIAEMWFLLISTYHRRFYKMRVSWEFNIYNLFKSFINTVLSFSNTMWILFMYDINIMRRCDVLVQNKTIHSLNFFWLIEYFFKNGNLSHW